MLINLSNHPSSKWSEKQKLVANELFGGVVDMQFPAVNPDGDEGYIANLANEYLQKILDYVDTDKNTVVHLMGEMSFTFALVSKLFAQNIVCVASTTERRVIEIEPNHKEVIFEFVKFRRYIH